MNTIETWFDFYCSLPKWWARGVTLKRLIKYKAIIINDQDFVSDIMLRHNGKNISPEIMKQENPELFEHLMSNMTGMIAQIIAEQKHI